MDREFEFEKPVAELEKALDKLRQSADKGDPRIAAQIAELDKTCEERKREIYDGLTPWQTVQVARHPRRPVLYDYIGMMFTDFVELHGDRCYGDDRALIGGFATLDGCKLMLIGHSKGKNVEENVRRNFGMARPEGYRKAMRLMHLAERFNIPVLTFIDTAGAYPGLDAEQRGQAEAIARNLTEMATLEVPIVSVVTGEGGSGGALGIGVADAVLMLSNAVYSVISPEGCASILWRDAAYSPQAAESLKITAKSLLSLGVIDEIIKEPAGGAHSNHEAAAQSIKAAVLRQFEKLLAVAPDKLKAKRFDKFSAMGKFTK